MANPYAESKSTTVPNSQGLSILQIILLGIILEHPSKAFGTALSKEMNRILGKDMSDAQIYMTLKRLEDRQLIESPETVPVPSVRGRGRPRRMYIVTEMGRRVLKDADSITFAFRPSRSRERDVGNGAEKEGLFTALVV